MGPPEPAAWGEDYSVHICGADRQPAGAVGQSRRLWASPCPTVPSVLSPFRSATGEKRAWVVVAVKRQMVTASCRLHKFKAHSVCDLRAACHPVSPRDAGGRGLPQQCGHSPDPCPIRSHLCCSMPESRLGVFSQWGTEGGASQGPPSLWMDYVPHSFFLFKQPRAARAPGCTGRPWPGACRSVHLPCRPLGNFPRARRACCPPPQKPQLSGLRTRVRAHLVPSQPPSLVCPHDRSVPFQGQE